MGATLERCACLHSLGGPGLGKCICSQSTSQSSELGPLTAPERVSHFSVLYCKPFNTDEV